MKREVERSKNIPALSLDLANLEILCQRLQALFDPSKKVLMHIDLKLASEKLSFETVDEIRAHTELKGTFSDFSVWLTQGESRIWLRSKSAFGGLPSVSATAATEAWCAGAVETAYAFASSNRVWYYWLAQWPLGLMLSGLVVLNWAFLVIGKGKLSTSMGIALFLAFLTFLILYIARSTVLPAATLRLSEETSFLRRNAAELSLLVATLSIVLTIVGWFVAK